MSICVQRPSNRKSPFPDRSKKHPMIQLLKPRMVTDSITVDGSVYDWDVYATMFHEVNRVLEECHAKGYQNIHVSGGWEVDWDAGDACCSGTFQVVFERPITQAEKDAEKEKKRVVRERNRKQREAVRDHELALLDKLKKKYE